MLKEKEKAKENANFVKRNIKGAIFDLKRKYFRVLYLGVLE